MNTSVPLILILIITSCHIIIHKDANARTQKGQGGTLCVLRDARLPLLLCYATCVMGKAHEETRNWDPGVDPAANVSLSATMDAVENTGFGYPSLKASIRVCNWYLKAQNRGCHTCKGPGDQWLPCVSEAGVSPLHGIRPKCYYKMSTIQLRVSRSRQRRRYLVKARTIHGE